MFQKHKILLLAIFFFGMSWGEKVQGQVSSYEELQAAYIYNFAKYVIWPAPTETFVVGVYGDLEIMEFLEKAFSGKKIAGRTVELKAIKTKMEALMCNIIYVPESSSRSMRQISLDTQGNNILIVTEDDLTRRGAAISFVVDNDHLRFILNRSALAAAGLSATEGLIKLAILQ